MKFLGVKIFFLFFICFLSCGMAQVKDTMITKTDSLLSNSIDTLKFKTDSLQHTGINSLSHTDSIKVNKIQTISFDSLLKKNKYLNLSSPPVSFIIQEKSTADKDFLFYLIGIFILLLAVFKVFYSRYFNTIFKVFFNTSLRQNQLTDLLLLAKLPSLMFNIFFVISAGLYVWLLLNYYHLLKDAGDHIFIPLSILVVAAIYFGKFLSLKFIGWITGMTASSNQYIFVIFLINKIICIVLIPFIVLLAFAPAEWLNVIVISSFLIVGLLFLMRYLRTFGLLQNQLQINRFHFLIYITAGELLPLAIIYKLILRLLL